MGALLNTNISSSFNSLIKRSNLTVTDKESSDQEKHSEWDITNNSEAKNSEEDLSWSELRDKAHQDHNSDSEITLEQNSSLSLNHQKSESENSTLTLINVDVSSHKQDWLLKQAILVTKSLLKWNSVLELMRQSEYICNSLKWLYDDQLTSLNKVKIAQHTIRPIIQTRVKVTLMKILTLEIVKIAEKIHKLKSYAEIICHSVNRCQWQLAINEELNSLLAMSTFKLHELSSSRHLVTLKWVFRIKYMSSGLVNRFKAHLVACEFTQIKDIVYDEMFTPTLHYKSLRLLLFLAVKNNWQI